MYLYVDRLTWKVKRVDIEQDHWKDILTNSNCVDLSKGGLIRLASVILAGALSDDGAGEKENVSVANKD